jgi:Trk K+ transport system NAD-binding subunit
MEIVNPDADELLLPKDQLLLLGSREQLDAARSVLAGAPTGDEATLSG